MQAEDDLETYEPPAQIPDNLFPGLPLGNGKTGDMRHRYIILSLKCTAHHSRTQ